MRLSSAIERAAQINPRGGGTAFAGRRHDWQTFVERVKRIAGGLTASGLAPNDRVAMISLNSERFCELVFAISWGGRVVQPVNMRLAATEMAEQIVDSGARLIITDEAAASAIAPTRSGQGNATRLTDKASAQRVERFRTGMRSDQVAQLAVALAADGAWDVTGQIFAVRGNEVILFNQPRPIASVTQPSGWSPADLIDQGLKALGPKFTDLGASASIFPYDPA